MPRRFAGDRLVIASHNHGKVEEIAATLSCNGKSANSFADTKC